MNVESSKEAVADDVKVTESNPPSEPQHKTFWQAALPVFACGAGLFSDGYINNVSSNHPHYA